jgi:hypothetical protein
MNGCQCNGAYIAAERMCLRSAIADNRQLLSEELGYDVDSRLATQDFLDHLIEAFSRQFRVNFCRACPFADQCDARLCAEGIKIQVMGKSH